MRKPSLQEFIGHAQGHSAEGCHPPECGSSGGAPWSALLGARQHSHETSLNPNSGNMCSQLGFREVMSPVPGDACPRADNTAKVVNRMCAEHEVLSCHRAGSSLRASLSWRV